MKRRVRKAVSFSSNQKFAVINLYQMVNGNWINYGRQVINHEVFRQEKTEARDKSKGEMA